MDERFVTVQHENQHNSDQITVDIFGCCYVRDIFNEYMQGPYKVNTYVMRMHLFQLNENRPSFSNVTEEELLDLAQTTSDLRVKEYLSHPFLRRTLLYSFNGFPRKLHESKHAEWLVISPFYDRHALLRITCRGKNEELYVQTDVTHIYDAICRYKGYDLEKVDANFNRSVGMDDFCRWIRGIYGDNIILIYGGPSNFKAPDHKTLEAVKPLPGTLNEISFCREVLRRIPVHYLDIPFWKIARDNDSLVHYEKYVYDYLREAVDCIVRGIGEIDEICIRYKQLSLELLLGVTPLIQYVLDKGNSLIKCGASIDSILELSSNVLDDYRIQDLIGRAYLSVNPPDLQKALEWFRRSYESGRALPNNISSTLDRIGTEESFSEKMKLLCDSVNAHSPQAFGLMGRAYRDGKGVPKDLNMAAYWMKQAVDFKVKWATGSYSIFSGELVPRDPMPKWLNWRSRWPNPVFVRCRFV